MARIVAVQSIVMTGRSLALPGGITPGQRIAPGTRMPPSWSDPFDSLIGQLYDQRSPPLSLVKTTSVFSSWPPSRRARMTRATLSSRLRTIDA